MTKSSDSKLIHVYYCVAGGHIHMRVFINGACMGNLVCRVGEMDQVKASMSNCEFIREGD